MVGALACAACGDGLTRPKPTAPTLSFYAQPLESVAEGRVRLYWRWTSSEATSVTTTLVLTPGGSVKHHRGFGQALGSETSFEGLSRCAPYTIEINARADTGAQAFGVVVISTPC